VLAAFARTASDIKQDARYASCQLQACTFGAKYAHMVGIKNTCETGSRHIVSALSDVVTSASRRLSLILID